jgi:CDP-paratose 2-epimerase
VVEAFERAEALSGKRMRYEYVEKNREGDHICYVSNLAKARAHFPAWDVTKTLDDIFAEIFANWSRRARKTA